MFAFRGCPLKEASVVFSDIKRTAEERPYDGSHARTLSIGPERLKLHYLSVLVGELENEKDLYKQNASIR